MNTDAAGQFFVMYQGSKLDFSIDWSAFLVTDTIAANGSTWTVPAGISQTSASNTANSTGIWVSAANSTAGTEYDLINKITTVGGRIASRTLRIKVIPPAAATTSLISLAYLKSVMGEPTSAPDTDPQNDLLASMANAASSAVMRTCGRTFLSGTFIEKIAAERDHILLREYPVDYISGIYSDTGDALTITNNSANAVGAFAWMQPDRKLGLQVVGGASHGVNTIDTSLAANDTLSELITAINGISGWHGVLASNRTGYEICEDLLETSAIRIPTTGGTLKMLENLDEGPYYFDDEPGILHRKGSHKCQDLWVKYHAGYSVIPEDLKLLVARYALALYQDLKADPGMQSERIGDYSYIRFAGNAGIEALERQLLGWKRQLC